MTDNLAIEIKHLNKSYNGVKTIKDVSLSVNHGEVFALLGPNGAGKTTTTEIMEGYRSRDSGEVSVLGFDPAKGKQEYRAQIGIVLQSIGVEPYLTVAETIEYYRGLYPHPRKLNEIIELVGLAEKRNSRVKKLSGGQQRRLDVAIALAGDPTVLFLDEPTEGFDPSARRNARGIVKNLSSLGKTIFLTTHYMDEAEFLADHVAIIKDGSIVTEGTVQTIAGRNTAQTTISFHLPPSAPPLPGSFKVTRTKKGGQEILLITTKDATNVLAQLTAWAVTKHLELLGLEVRQPSLEDMYLKVTQATEDHHE
jgi:ABC-2 type transport system ATP-binding protein